jgi:hypothetical protein
MLMFSTFDQSSRYRNRCRYVIAGLRVQVGEHSLTHIPTQVRISRTGFFWLFAFDRSACVFVSQLMVAGRSITLVFFLFFDGPSSRCRAHLNRNRFVCRR